MNDCDSLTSWSADHAHEDGNTATMTCENNDYLVIDVTNSVGNKICYYEIDITNIGTTDNGQEYPAFMVRFRTSSASIKAKVELVFTAGSQNILDTTDTQSTYWMIHTGTATTAKTIDKIRIYANEAIGQVYYDFLLCHKGTFTLPNTAYGASMDFPPRRAILDIPGKHTDTTQNLGTKNATVQLSCDLNIGTWTRTGLDTYAADVFLEQIHQCSSYPYLDEPWQWLDTGYHQFKVTVHPRYHWRNDDDMVVRTLDLMLEEYSLGNKTTLINSRPAELFFERWGTHI